YQFADDQGNIIDWMSSRHDVRGNKIEQSLLEFGFASVNAFTGFHWGNDEVYGCVANSGGYILTINNAGTGITGISATSYGVIRLQNNQGNLVSGLTSSFGTIDLTFNTGNDVFSIT